jgi:hypothetical protein
MAKLSAIKILTGFGFAFPELQRHVLAAAPRACRKINVTGARRRRRGRGG